jgi:hypothetical protein
MQTRKYKPERYYRGLSRKKKEERYKEIQKFGALSWKDPKAYKGFKTDAVPTKTSSYTESWRKRFPDANSLEQKAAATGVPLKYIKESYNRGMAAWRTGHRPGATEQQWGYARVHSFLLCGKTHYTTDADIVARSKESKSAAQWWKQCPKNKQFE